MAIFAHKQTKTLDVPIVFNDEGDSRQYVVVIRQLNPRQIEAAVKETQRRSFEDVKALGGFSVLKELRELVTDEQAKDEGEKNPLLIYDRETLIDKGVVSWTFPEDKTPENIANLTEDVRDWLATEILRLTKPALVQSQEERKAAQKNG